MAIDEAIMLLQAGGVSPPTLRFYGWSPPAVTLGYFQKPGETLDLEACRRLGVDVVRRPTGGRAVLHDREVTYSIIAPEENPAVRGTVSESYLRLSQGLVLGLRLLGLEVSRNQDSGPAAKGPACFEGPGLYELMVNGRKLAGNAQCRKGGCVLQHGALPIVNDSHTLFRLLQFRSEALREEKRLIYCQKATSLEETLGRPVDPQEVIAALAGGFSTALGIDLEPEELNDEELDMALKIKWEKYGNHEEE